MNVSTRIRRLRSALTSNGMRSRMETLGSKSAQFIAHTSRSRRSELMEWCLITATGCTWTRYTCRLLFQMKSIAVLWFYEHHCLHWIVRAIECASEIKKFFWLCHQFLIRNAWEWVRNVLQRHRIKLVGRRWQDAIGLLYDYRHAWYV